MPATITTRAKKKNPMTLAEQVRQAQRIVALWPPEKRAWMVLEGQDIYRDRKTRRGETF